MLLVKNEGEKWARQDLRAKVISGHPSLNPDVKDGGANLRLGGKGSIPAWYQMFMKY
jgi:hypothetical protein